MFRNLKKQVQDNFKKLALSQDKLFVVNVDKEKIWDLYINGFADEELRKEHICNCCKSFIRQFSGIVTIENNQMKSIWDITEIEPGYEGSINGMRDYIHSLPIADVYLSKLAGLGTDTSSALVEEKPIVWNHFYLLLDPKFVHRGYDSIEAATGVLRDNKNVLKRSLEELSTEAIDTVLELIAQGSLYRGPEFKEMVKGLQTLKREYVALTDATEKDNFVWIKSTQVSGAISRIKNTSIGTLLIDLSEGKDLDVAVSAFERVVAPTNYKRPTALVTPKMVAEAKKKLEELGFSESLDRRLASPEDLSVEDILFTDKSSGLKDVFDEMSGETLVNPKTLTKVEEISVEDFLKNVVPTSNSVEVLVENSHLSNMVTLLTAANKDTPSMFKWDNSFSWSYTGGITDSMKENVKAAGGKVDGVLRFSIQWNDDGKSIIDLDAHCVEPGGNHIYYGDKVNCTTGGNLDVDMISPRHTGVENITWSNLSKMKEGTYKFYVKNFSGHRNFTGVRCEVEYDGQIFEFGTDKPYQGDFQVAEVTYSKKDGFSIKGSSTTKSSISSREKWGVATNQFHKVKNIMLSPNHWNGVVGNKHYIFTLEDCQVDEEPRPFFNEFLKPELDKDRKVFEILASKLKVGKGTGNQLSGVGFSETQRNHVFVRVEGSFKRTLKVNF